MKYRFTKHQKETRGGFPRGDTLPHFSSHSLHSKQQLDEIYRKLEYFFGYHLLGYTLLQYFESIPDSVSLIFLTSLLDTQRALSIRRIMEYNIAK